MMLQQIALKIEQDLSFSHLKNHLSERAQLPRNAQKNNTTIQSHVGWFNRVLSDDNSQLWVTKPLSQWNKHDIEHERWWENFKWRLNVSKYNKNKPILNVIATYVYKTFIISYYLQWKSQRNRSI